MAEQETCCCGASVVGGWPTLSAFRHEHTVCREAWAKRQNEATVAPTGHDLSATTATPESAPVGPVGPPPEQRG